KLSLIHVTHDQTEALTFAEHVVVMSRGKAVQIGTPGDLFERPALTFFGHFIGWSGTTFLRAQWRRGSLQFGGYPLAGLSPGQADVLGGADTLQLGVRPEYLQPCEPHTQGAVPVRITRVQDLGTYLLLTGDFQGAVLRARAAAGHAP